MASNDARSWDSELEEGDPKTASDERVLISRVLEAAADSHTDLSRFLNKKTMLSHALRRACSRISTKKLLRDYPDLDPYIVHVYCGVMSGTIYNTVKMICDVSRQEYCAKIIMHDQFRAAILLDNTYKNELMYKRKLSAMYQRWNRNGCKVDGELESRISYINGFLQSHNKMPAILAKNVEENTQFMHKNLSESRTSWDPKSMIEVRKVFKEFDDYKMKLIPELPMKKNDKRSRGRPRTNPEPPRILAQ